MAKMLKGLCGMRLKTAGVVLGWLGVVGSFVMTILVSASLGYSEVIARSIWAGMREKQSYYEIHTALIMGCSVFLAIAVLNVLASGLLVLGTIKERHLWLLPWLINSGVGLVLSGLLNLFLLSAYISGLFMFNSLLALGLQIYTFCGIYSLFKQIQLTNELAQSLIEKPQVVEVPNQDNTYPNYAKF